MVDKECDHKSVGVLVWRDGVSGREIMLIERKKFPPGLALSAGHEDAHGSPEKAARAELQEETGLIAEQMKLIWHGRKENPCRRGSTWHDWYVYEALEFSGDLKPSPDETKQAGWYSEEQLNALAQRTKDYLVGGVPENEWQQSPGLEPVWYELLQELLIIWPPAIGNKCSEA